ncbi:hypothetical protein C6503_17795 [Candidatus Poribacteria bacterium]|nr:MAG: hypothetical protein C6503_17795 [Candidatus Poribacteria bacterium]
MPDIENTLKTRIQTDRADTFVVIVPTDSARLQRQRELVGYHPNQAVSNLRVYTLGSFIQRLYEKVSPAKPQISQGVQNLWLHEIANLQSDNPDAYRYDTFRPSQNIPVPDSTLSVIADTINRLKEYGEDTLNIGGESQNPTEEDLVRIYNDYETKLEYGWIDEPSKRLCLANDFDSQFMSQAFPRVDLVAVEGFTVLSKADIKILTHVAEIPNIEMWFRTDCVEENEALYKNIINLVSRFSAVNANIDPDYERVPDRHEHFAKHLFRTDNPRVTPIAAPHIKVLEPADRSEEVEQIAHLIQKHVSEGHCKLSEICVACYNIRQYAQRISEIFPAYGIPYSLVEMLPLTRSEVVKSIFSRLSSRRVPLNDAYFSDVEPASPTSRFHPNEFQRYVDDLLKKGEVVQHILNPMLEKNNEIVEGEVEAYRHFKRIVKELCSVLRSESERSRFLDEYVEKLHHIAKHTHYQNRVTTKEETVKIASQLSELRSLEFNTVFLCDFAEGSFPENYGSDPLLPDHPYRTEEEHLHNNRFMFYGVLKSFRERLYLLAPQREREAELIASPFLGQLKAIADVDETEKIPNPSQGSVTGFLSAYGNHVWTTPPTPNGGFAPEIANMRPLINHVIAVEKSREETHKHLAYEGVLTAAPLSVDSRKQLERRHRWTYSVTELETYAKCPFQYFVGNVLKLGIKDEEVEDELSSLEKGSLLHKVLFTFFYNRREQGYPSIPECTDDDFEAAKRQLNEILQDASEERRGERNEPPIGANNLFWQTDIAKLRVALHKWLEAERTSDLSVMPHYFEVSFGQNHEPRDPELSCLTPISIGNVRMRGKIDRIDIGNGAFNVIDYKTGNSTIRMPEILSGRSLQLSIYLQIAKKLLDNNGITDLEAASGLYHKIRLDQCKVELGIGTEFQNGIAYKSFSGKDWKKFNSSGQLLEGKVFDERLLRVSGYVQQYVESISKGDFPLITRVETFVASEGEGNAPIAPNNKTEPCNYCAYKRGCRVGAISESSQSDE